MIPSTRKKSAECIDYLEPTYQTISKYKVRKRHCSQRVNLSGRIFKLFYPFTDMINFFQVTRGVCLYLKDNSKIHHHLWETSRFFCNHSMFLKSGNNHTKKLVVCKRAWPKSHTPCKKCLLHPQGRILNVIRCTSHNIFRSCLLIVVFISERRSMVSIVAQFIGPNHQTTISNITWYKNKMLFFNATSAFVTRQYTCTVYHILGWVYSMDKSVDNG